jgi:Na+-driven multidrug efflux pump
LLFFFAALFLPESLMRILTDNEEIISLGARYLRILSVSYLFMSVSQIYLAVIRSMERAKLSATISSISLLFDTAITALVVFVLFPHDPVKAVSGVAVSTMLSRALELTLCMVHSMAKGKVKLHLAQLFHFDRSLFWDFAKYTAPVQSNYLVWGGALTATAAIIGHVSNDMVAANSVASGVKNLVLVLCAGISQGGGVLIGKALGEGRVEDAKRDGGKVVRWALVLGIVAGGLILLGRPLALSMTSLTEEARSILDGMLYICSFYCVGKSLNSTVIAGIFCAGGDSKFGFLCDTIVMWGVIIPAGFICAFVLKLPPVMLYAVLCLDEFLKIPFMAIHYCKYKWLKNITRENAAKEATA